MLDYYSFCKKYTNYQAFITIIKQGYIVYLVGPYYQPITLYILRKTYLFPIYESFLETLFGKGESYNGYGGNLDMIFDDIPVFGNLCRIGTYTWILAFALFYEVYKKWNTFLMTLGLELGLWLTVFLSPVIMYRYCAPIIFSTPLYILLLFNYHKNMDANWSSRWSEYFILLVMSITCYIWQFMIFVSSQMVLSAFNWIWNIIIYLYGRIYQVVWLWLWINTTSYKRKYYDFYIASTITELECSFCRRKASKVYSAY